MTELLEQEYGYLWNGSEPGWAVMLNPELGGYLVFNKLTHTALVIESEATNEAVCRQLIESGCEVLTDIPTKEGTDKTGIGTDS